jgi:glyoxylate carboligase
MATAYAKATGKLGVCLATSGPGSGRSRARYVAYRAVCAVRMSASASESNG